MANTFRLKRSSVAGKVPTTGDLQLGELALNTYDGRLFTLRNNGTPTVVELSGGGVSDGDKGDITVSNTGATWTLDPSGVTAGTYNGSATAVTPFTVDAKGRITGTGAAVTITPAFSSITGKPTTLAGYGITDAQAQDADLTAIAALAGTSGLLRKTGAGTWSLDTASYLTGNQSISLSGDASGSGTTAIAVTLANSGVTAGTYNNSATAVTPLTVDAKGRITGTGAAVTVTPAWASITSKPTTLSGYGITDAASSTHTHGNISNAGAIGTTSGLPIITTTSGVLTTGAFGTAAGTFCQGNDSRLSDDRPSPFSITFNNGGAGGASGSAYDGAAALTVSYNTVGAPSTTGANASGSWGISVTGSAASCTGNAATATTWQTARTLTIAGTGKSVNGSADVSWSAAEIGFSAAQAYNTASIAGVTTAAAISFGAESFDTDSLWAAGAPTRLTIPRAGIYRVEFSALVTFTAETYVLTFSLRKNGTEVRSFVFRENWRWFSGDTLTVNLGEVESLAAGDYLEVFHSGDSTGYSIGTAAGTRAQLSIHRVA